MNCTEISNDLIWEPLPPRKKSLYSDTADEHYDENGVNKKTKTATRIRKKVAEYEQILANIEARKNISHDHSTLESKDGCSSTFYEYLDHTADVQCHSWGTSLCEAFENMAPCMLNYMTDISLITIVEDEDVELQIEGHDLHSLLYNYMNEILFKFSTDSFCTIKATIKLLDKENFKIIATLHGDIYNPQIHSSGTEIKAITYSNMQIHESIDKCDLYVIVDI